jgi:hypothetical protein
VQYNDEHEQPNIDVEFVKLVGLPLRFTGGVKMV